ncbi:ACT domain-containing protein [Alteromonas sediminis]|uniref:ACT domain-containing protein n=1 Tax=Alteromonas sediminis TaxID=2259342 RepID=A0A3N5XYX0_9ALTE|nr:ACT domain-containing protein [Alteromonas sediminis]RPJ65663.1 ACT domain-containing protein [Alteromonas sediminis]
MTGEKDLSTLINNMEPLLCSKYYVFCCLSAAERSLVESLSPLGTFTEREGLTVIVEESTAQRAGLGYEGVFRCITLNIHSSLEAVGLTAAVANALAKEGISANVVAAYYHDHVFVPDEHAQSALKTLQALTNL